MMPANTEWYQHQEDGEKNKNKRECDGRKAWKLLAREHKKNAKKKVQEYSFYKAAASTSSGSWILHVAMRRAWSAHANRALTL